MKFLPHDSPNPHPSSFCVGKFHAKILRGSPSGGVKQGRCG